MKNNNARILYIEDEAIVAVNTLETLKKKSYTEVDRFKRWTDAKASLKVNTYDVAILDVKLEGSVLDGIDIGNILASQFNLPIVITTSFSSEIVLSRLASLPNAQYLLKPFTAEQLDACIQRVLKLVDTSQADSNKESGQLKARQKETIFVQTEGRQLSRIDFNDILYLSADRSYTDIHLINGRQRTVEKGIKAMIMSFDRDDLFQIHKSYAVPYHAILNISTDQVELIDNKKIPIGRTYREKLKLTLGKR